MRVPQQSDDASVVGLFINMRYSTYETVMVFLFIPPDSSPSHQPTQVLPGRLSLRKLISDPQEKSK